MVRTYSELIKIPDFLGRFEYLKLDGRVGELTFGYERYLNQALYNSADWRYIRPRIIVRDMGTNNECNDMACDGYPIGGRIIVHHINPITIDMIVEGDPMVFDPENLISVAVKTHEAIHYGNDSLLPKPIIERKKGDTTLWRR